MDRQTFERGVAAAWGAAQKLNLGETFSNGGSLAVDTEFRDLILNHNTPYEDIFLFGLRNSNYNFLLSDHSFFQFTWFKENDIRFAYYPNPFLGQQARQLILYKQRLELFRADLISYEDFLQLLGDAVGKGRVPVIRYENSPDQYRELEHPCSHFHIGLHGDDRWAVRRVLTPHMFVLLILRNYYGPSWRSSEMDDEGRFPRLDSDMRQARAQSLLLEVEHFKASEENMFYMW